MSQLIEIESHAANEREKGRKDGRNVSQHVAAMLCCEYIADFLGGEDVVSTPAIKLGSTFLI
jgi:hypothetical protein